jgi:hypothetical protein
MYTTIIRMGLHYSRTQAGYKIGDDGAAYDSRVCEIPTWILGMNDQTELNEFFNNPLIGRGNNFQLELGTASGFFPFGADKGDSSNFIVSLLEFDRKGAQLNPFLHHLNSIKLVYVSGPSSAYTPAGKEAEGSLQIGTVTTLRNIQTFPQALQEQAIVREVSRSGVGSSVDQRTSGDLVETALDLELRPGNCAALITYLLSARGGDITVVTPAATWLFGVPNSHAGTYAVKLLSPEIKITHDNFNLFKTQIKLWMKSNDTE